MEVFTWKYIAVIVAFNFISDFCHGLQNVALLISPPVVQRGNNVTLICQYDLEGSALYAVKWYRGQYEFYRFTPSEIPTEKIFLFPGINVDVSKSNASQVVLKEVGFNLSGNISCEVTTEGPGFSTSSAVKNMIVVDLPKNGPTIITNKARYDPGDKLIANCSSSPSKPHAILSFYINNILVGQQQTKILPGPESLSWSFLAVNVTLLPSHFDDQRSVLLLKCAAIISSLYHNSTELRIPYRKEPIPERVTSRSTASFCVYNAVLPLSSILLLVARDVIIVEHLTQFFMA